ncbi:hypothetical protein VNO77_23197 [Canavalia gladiata]|uniref:Uncharacterized protein n=1 Tax=Canavalia gladiata TaxID=3824 RepID=A0AAN9L450_CANGL
MGATLHPFGQPCIVPSTFDTLGSARHKVNSNDDVFCDNDLTSSWSLHGLFDVNPDSSHGVGVIVMVNLGMGFAKVVRELDSFRINVIWDFNTRATR